VKQQDSNSYNNNGNKLGQEKDYEKKEFRSIYSEGNKDNWQKEKSQISAIKNILLGDKELPEETEINKLND